MNEKTPGNVQVSWLHVRRNDEEEAMQGYFAHPASRPAPGIVLLQEIFGVNEAMRREARNLAALGFAVVVPDLFWRQEPKVDLGYSDEDRKKGFELLQRYDESVGVNDVVAVADWLRTAEGCTGQVSYVGFCIGGRVAVLAGARDPRTHAIGSFYGVRLDTLAETLKSIRRPLQFHVGDKDAHIPGEAISVIKATLQDSGNAEVFVYPGAQHGFFNPLRTQVYHADAASAARERLITMLRR
jgi:carboxymethylenebutenolidase